MDKRSGALGAILSVIVCASCRGSSTVVEGSSKMASHVSEVALSFEGDADSSGFEITLPLWWPLDPDMKLDRDGRVLKGHTVKMQGGRFVSVIAADRDHKQHSLYKEMFEDLRSFRKSRIVEEPGFVFVLSGVTSDALPNGIVKVYQHDVRTDIYMLMSVHVRKGEGLTKIQVDELLNALKRAVVGVSK